MCIPVLGDFSGTRWIYNPNLVGFLTKEIRKFKLFFGLGSRAIFGYKIEPPPSAQKKKKKGLNKV